MGSHQGKSKHGSQPPTNAGDSCDRCSDFSDSQQLEKMIVSMLPALPINRNEAINSSDGAGDSKSSSEETSACGSVESGASLGNSYTLGDVNLRECAIRAERAMFGHNISMSSDAFDESLRLHEKSKDVLPNMEKKLRDFWLQKQNQSLEIVSSTIDIARCPMAEIKDENGETVELEFSKHKSVLLEGFFGSGKTTFARQQALTWARSASEHFKLLFFLDPHNFDGSIAEALVEQASVDYEEPNVIWSLIKRNQDQVFIIVDAFDFLNEIAADDVKKLLSSEILPQSHVFVTCNPRKSEEIKELFHKNYSISPFSENQIHRFFDAFGKDVKSNVYRMLELESRDILQCPLFLHIMCVIAKTNPEHVVVRNITELYKVFISSIMSEKKIKVDFKDIFIEFGGFCCRNTSVKLFNERSVNELRHKDQVQALELLVRDADKGFYRVKQRNFSDFAVALFLSTLEDERFEQNLRRFLSDHDVSELFLRFLVGLLPDKFDQMFHLLPRRLSQNWNLDLINILGEAGVFEKKIAFAENMPKWIELQIMSALSSTDKDGFCNLQAVAVVNTGLNPGFNPQLCLTSKIKHHLLTLFRSCAITRIDLDLVEPTRPNYRSNGKCSGEFVLDILSGIADSNRLTEVKVKCCEITRYIRRVIAHLFENVKNVNILFDSAREFCKLANYLMRTLKNPQIESLEISTKQPLGFPEVAKLCQVLKKCSNISRLKLDPVGSGPLIFDNILKLNLKSAVISSQLKFEPKADGRSLSADSLPRPASVASVLKLASNSSTVEHLDVSGLHAIAVDLDAAFAIVSRSRLKSLRMVDCCQFGMYPCSLDLTILVPENRRWELLDFSGWELQTSSEEGNCGSVRSLVAEKCDCLDIFQFVHRFKVEKLVCDDEHLQVLNRWPETENYCDNLSNLKVNCCTTCHLPARMSKFVIAFSNLSKVKLLFNDKLYRNEHVDSIWGEMKKLKNLQVFHLVLFEWQDVESMKIILKIFKLRLEKMKLTLDVGRFKKYDYAAFHQLFDAVYDRIKNFELKAFQVCHKSYNYDSFLKVLDEWQKTKGTNVLSFKLINSNKNDMRIVQLTL